jgi:hypothetical protein
MRLQPEVADAVLQVAQDLGLWRVALGPVVPGRERERVQVGGNVAGGSRVRVGAPNSPDRLTALEDGEVGEPGLLQSDGESDAAEAGADDADRELA